MKRLLLSSFAALGLIGAPAHAVLIDFAAGAEAGQVDIVASDLGDEIVSAFGIVVDYGPLSLVDAIVGDIDTFGFLGPDPDQAPQLHAFSWLSDGLPFGNLAYTDFQDIIAPIGGPGTVYLEDLSLILDEVYLASIQPNDFILASLFFDEEVVDLGLLSFIWDVDQEWDVKGLNGQIIFPSAEVPEPATLFLLGSGLLGFGLTRRRARS